MFRLAECFHSPLPLGRQVDELFGFGLPFRRGVFGRQGAGERDQRRHGFQIVSRQCLVPRFADRAQRFAPLSRSRVAGSQPLQQLELLGQRVDFEISIQGLQHQHGQRHVLRFERQAASVPVEGITLRLVHRCSRHIQQRLGQLLLRRGSQLPFHLRAEHRGHLLLRCRQRRGIGNNRFERGSGRSAATGGDGCRPPGRFDELRGRQLFDLRMCQKPVINLQLVQLAVEGVTRIVLILVMSKRPILHIPPGLVITELAVHDLSSVPENRRLFRVLVDGDRIVMPPGDLGARGIDDHAQRPHSCPLLVIELDPGMRDAGIDSLLPEHL